MYRVRWFRIKVLLLKMSIFLSYSASHSLLTVKPCCSCTTNFVPIPLLQRYLLVLLHIFMQDETPQKCILVKTAFSYLIVISLFCHCGGVDYCCEPVSGLSGFRRPSKGQWRTLNRSRSFVQATASIGQAVDCIKLIWMGEADGRLTMLKQQYQMRRGLPI